jgi:hypothetical protein
MVADRASYRGACYSVVTCHVARDAPDYGAFDTAFRVRRINGCPANQYRYARTCKVTAELRLPVGVPSGSCLTPPTRYS